MPLSTVLGAQSLVQPAVCTTATRPASPYTGQAIYDTTLSQVLVYNGTAFAPVSRVLQVVGASSTTAVATTSTSYVTSGLAATITPSSSSNKVLVQASFSYDMSSSSVIPFTTLFRGTVAGTNLATGSEACFAMQLVNGVGQTRGVITAQFLDSPATTSATTYTVGIRVNSATITFTAMIGGATGTIVLTEVSA